MYVPRLEAPSNDNNYYLVTRVGGLNECIEIENGSALPNCVGYAWGRCYEYNNTRPTLSTGDAGLWYLNTSDGYERGQDPRLGAIICYSKPNEAGHVAVVEEIKPNGNIITSNSGYNSSRFWIEELSPPFNRTGYIFQGFIYSYNDSPTPVIRRKNKFRWVLYAKKIRNKHIF